MEKIPSMEVITRDCESDKECSSLCGSVCKNSIFQCSNYFTVDRFATFKVTSQNKVMHCSKCLFVLVYLLFFINHVRMNIIAPYNDSSPHYLI